MSELDIYRRQGFGKESGWGDNPALLVIDFVNAFTVADQFGGGDIVDAVNNTKALLAKTREVGLPIVFTRIVYAGDGSDTGVFCLKVPGLRSLTEDATESQVVSDLAPAKGEYVLARTQPSAFFGTGLADWLAARRVDTVLVTGCTTSGCVRASVVDSMSHNFRTIVVTDCVGDRAVAPHEANLFDMAQKYADLMTAQEVIDRLDMIA